MYEALFTILHEAYIDAMNMVLRAGQQAVDNLLDTNSRGALVLEIDLYPDEAFYGEFFDTDQTCWDRCNGITNWHRSGWCRVNPEHADFDCGCGEGYWDDDYDGDPTEGFEPGQADFIEAFATVDAAIQHDMAEAYARATGDDEEPF